MSDRSNGADAALRAVGWKPVRAREFGSFGALFPNIKDINSIQSASMQMVQQPGVYVIEAPMGFGKTEAALAVTYQLIRDGQAGGLYFALPAQVTSNRIYERVEPFVRNMSAEPAEVRLAHSSSWLFDPDPLSGLHPAYPGGFQDETEEHVREGHSWFASAKKALLAPFGVGTIDQALLGIVAAKHFFLRQFGLAGKVVVLDEVHSYDIYTGTLIGELVRRLRELQCTVIILSGTLTGARRRELLGLDGEQKVSMEYPLISGFADYFVEQPCAAPPPKIVRVREVSGVLPVEEALERSREGECVLWIRNTVDEAQETYRALRSANLQGGPSIALLHSRFPFFRREVLEGEWLERLGKNTANRPHGCVLVSTQVAEQSVDIDADLLITDLAPTDMLLQRIGRLWRHDRPARPCLRPELWIQMPDAGVMLDRSSSGKTLRKALGRTSLVYSPYVLLRSFQQWSGKKAISVPGDIRAILEATYSDPPDTEPIGWQELRDQMERQREKMRGLALSATNVWNQPALEDEEGVRTRYGSYPMARLLLATEIAHVNSKSARLRLLSGVTVTVHERRRDFDAAKDIYRNLVPVRRRTVEPGLAKAPRWLVDYIRQSVAIGLLKSDGSVIWPGEQTESGLSYDANEGIVIHQASITDGRNGEFDEPYD